MSESTNLVQHLDPNQDNFRMAGIALLAEGHKPSEVREFYHRTGTMPSVHRAVLYEVGKRDVEGDKLRHTFITLDENRVLELGISFCRVHTGKSASDPSEYDMELARQTLETLGILKYDSTITTGDGRKAVTTINITDQIHDLIGLHLAGYVRES